MAYQSIYDWKVHTSIPEDARAVLKADFERWLCSEIPYSMILNVANSRPTNEKLTTDVADLQRMWEEDEQKVRASTLKSTALADCLAEHCLYGSTIEIPPSPFILPVSYLQGQPVDVYDRVLEKASSKAYRQRGLKIKGYVFFGE